MTARDLLREAWPDGFLAMRGVGTVEGWSFVRANPDGISWRVLSPHDTIHALYPRRIQHVRRTGEALECWSDNEIEVACAAGSLIPNLDPHNDPATWACAKRDLAQAAAPTLVGAELTWFCDERGWWLLGRGFTRAVCPCFPRIDPNFDHPTALTIARASLRERS